MLDLTPDMVELVPYVGGAAGVVLFGSGVPPMDALWLIGGTWIAGQVVRNLKLAPLGGLEPSAKPGAMTMLTRLAVPMGILYWMGDLTMMNAIAYKLGEVTAEVMFQGQTVMGAIMS
jgi:hypothetical protein